MAQKHSEKTRKYRREWMRRKRAQEPKADYKAQLLSRGKCGICEILLISRYHTDCPGVHLYKDLSTPSNSQDDGQMKP